MKWNEILILRFHPWTMLFQLTKRSISSFFLGKIFFLLNTQIFTDLCQLNVIPNFFKNGLNEFVYNFFLTRNFFLRNTDFIVSFFVSIVLHHFIDYKHLDFAQMKNNLYFTPFIFWSKKSFYCKRGDKYFPLKLIFRF